MRPWGCTTRHGRTTSQRCCPPSASQGSPGRARDGPSRPPCLPCWTMQGSIPRHTAPKGGLAGLLPPSPREGGQLGVALLQRLRGLRPRLAIRTLRTCASTTRRSSASSASRASFTWSQSSLQSPSRGSRSPSRPYWASITSVTRSITRRFTRRTRMTSSTLPASPASPARGWTTGCTAASQSTSRAAPCKATPRPTQGRSASAPRAS
mmetsp:Transcript_149/g.415  ORF Transcript_149/g.415 Transcript_149/m.415 type:complete len:208 (-) Transcript_149:764-1387(-)